MFAENTEVILGPDVETVYGEVPSGKTLRVRGDTVITSSETLNVAGTVIINPGKTLSAAYTSAEGGLTGSGKISGEGTVSLPYASGSGTPADSGVMVYTTPKKVASEQAIGSIISTAASKGQAVIGTDIPTLFTALGSPLSLADIKDLPATNLGNNANDVLILSGNNTLEGATFTPNAKVTIAGTLSSKSGTAVTTLNGSNITVNAGGVLDLVNATDTISAGQITNNGTIKSVATTGNTQIVHIQGGTGDGTIELNAVGDLATEVAELSQKVVIGAGGKFIAAAVQTPIIGNNKTITVAEGGILDFGVANAALNLTPATLTITNNGTVATMTTSPVALGTILEGVTGVITSGGAVTANANAITVKSGTTFTHGTGTFAGGAGALTIENNAKATFNTGIFGTQTGPVKIEGEAIFTQGTFATLAGGLTIGQNANVTFTAATFAMLDEDLVIKGSVKLKNPAALAPLQNVIVNSASDTLTIIEGAGSLAIKAEKTLTNNGTIDLGPAGILKLGTTDVAEVATIVNATPSTGTPGRIIAGPTVITGTWEATASGDTGNNALITSSSAGALITIGGSATTGLKAGANGKIVQNAAATGNTSVLNVGAGAAVDLDTAGRVELAATATTTAGSTAGAGKIIAGPTEITGVWTATGTGTIAITPAATGATIATGTTATLVAGVGTITQKTKAAGSLLTITGNGIDLGASTGKLSLVPSNTPADSGSTSGTITAGATTITGAWKPVGTGGDIAITSGADGIGAIINATTATGLEAVSGGTITQAAVLNNTLKVEASTTLDLTGATLVLTAGTNPGAIGGSTGKITAGKTEITGIWSATGTSGTVTITGAAAGATIAKTGAATGLLGGASGVITQLAGSNNNLILSAVILDLKANGSILLKAAANDQGKVTLLANTVVLCGTGETFLTNPNAIGTQNATIGANLAFTQAVTDGKIHSITGDGNTSAVTNTIVPSGTSGGTNDISISNSLVS
jgi:hypothetical protein